MNTIYKEYFVIRAKSLADLAEKIKHGAQVIFIEKSDDEYKYRALIYDFKDGYQQEQLESS